MSTIDSLQRAVRVARSQAALARLSGVPQPNISRWLRRHGRVSAEAAVAIERAVGVPRHELRPDLWAPPKGRAAR